MVCLVLLILEKLHERLVMPFLTSFLLIKFVKRAFLASFNLFFMNLFINYPFISTLCIILFYLIFFIIIFLIIKLPEPFSNIIAAFAAIISLVFAYALILIF